MSIEREIHVSTPYGFVILLKHDSTGYFPPSVVTPYLFSSNQVLAVGGSSADIDVFTNFGYRALSLKFSQ